MGVDSMDGADGYAESAGVPFEQARSDASYSQQIEDSISNFVSGWIVLVLTVFFMYAVEQAIVKFATLSRRAQMACRFVKDNMVIDPDFDGRVVLVKGICKLRGAPMANSDTQTGFKADTSKGNVIRLNRVAQMYQWVEHEHKRGGGDRRGDRKPSRRMSTRGHSRDVSPNRRTDHDNVYYTYSLEWCETDHDSSQFHGMDKDTYNDHNNYDGAMMGNDTVRFHDVTHTTHRNPLRSPDIKSMSTDASASVGAYALTERQVKMMVNYEDCVMNGKDYVSAPNKPSVETDDDRNSPYCYLIYKPANASKEGSLKHPEVGMVRVRYEVVYENGHVTTVGVQRGSTFRPFTQEDANKYDKGCLGFGGDNASGDDGMYSGGTYQSVADEEDPYGNDDAPGSGLYFSGGADCCICCLPLQMASTIIHKCVSFVVGDDMLLLEERWVSVTDIFVHANSGANIRVVVLRFVGMMLIWTAITMIFDPISTILSFIPLIGGMAQGLFGVLTGILAILLGITIISFAWVTFHPEVLFFLLVGIGAVCILYGSTEAWESTGYVLSALSLYPAAVFTQNLINERAFAAGQAELDRQHATVQIVPSAARMPTAYPVEGEKAGLVQV